jgi:hypothetical protein
MSFPLAPCEALLRSGLVGNLSDLFEIIKKDSGQARMTKLELSMWLYLWYY